MPVYTGSTKYPYALTVNYNGVTSNASAVSENVQPIVVDSSTKYQFTTVLKMAATWSSGVTITVTYYNSSNSSVGSVTATQSSMTGGVLYTLSTTAGVAPANTAYAVLVVQLNGAPATTNTLSILQAGLYNTNNPNLDYEVNQNAAFANGFQPWTANNNAQLGWTWNPLQVADGNYDSMLIAGIVELIGGPSGVPTDIPELVDANGIGATYRLLAPPSTNSVAFGYEMSYDLGAPQPTTDVVESLLLDGERPFGYRASNRTITLPVLIEGTSQAIVQAAREYLMMLIDQQIWKLTWTPASNGLPMVFDCFRASPTVVSYGFNYNRDPQTAGTGGLAYAVMNLTFQAMPYGHSGVDGTKDLAFSSQLVSGKAQNAAVSIDNFTNVSGTGWTKDSRWSSSPYTFNDFETGTNGTTLSTSNTASTVADPGISAFTSVFTGTNSTSKFSSTHAAHGTLSANFNTGSSSEAAFVEWDLPSGVNKEWFRFYVYATANPSANTTLWYSFSTSSSTVCAKVRLTSSGTLAMVNQVGTTVFTTTSTIALNQWVRIEGFVAASLINGQVGLSYYATADSTTPTETKTSSFGQQTGGPLSIVKMGVVETTQANYSIYVDDVALSSQGPIGPYSPFSAVNTNSAVGTAAHFTPPRPLQQPYPAATYSNSTLNSSNLAGLTSLNWWFGQAYDYAYGHDPTFRSTVVFRWTLTDVNGHTLKFSKTFHNVKWSKNSSKPTWSRLSAPIPQGSTTFNYSNVVSYSVTFTNHSSGGLSGYIKMHAWLSNLQGLPETITNNPGTPRANVFNIFGAPGSARSPISVQAQLPAQTDNVVKELTKSGSWRVPPGVYSIQAECWGGGGAGGSRNSGTNYVTSGGGGGEYAAEPSISVVPGTLIPYTIGAGGTAGQLVNTVNTFNDPGVGHWVCPAGVTSIQVECWGGGAAGAAGGGGGGGGEYAKETSISVTPGKTYVFVIGKAGVPNTGKSAAANGARNGATSIFYGITTNVFAHGGKSPATGTTAGGTGGTGSTNTVHFNGGNGGKSPGASGGGGGASGGASGRGANGGTGVRGLNVGQGAHLTGGAGGNGATSGGASGGAGANAPGFPVSGNTGGGGGGGGYSNNGHNYKGALAGTGQIKVTYQVNLGNPVNGGNTVFGVAGLTSSVVTANGGSTGANNNSPSGATGGTGSSNSVHFDGGPGYPIVAGTNANGLIAGSSNTFNTCSTFAFNSTSGTSSASSVNFTQGVLMVCVAAASAVSDLTVTDNAGNTYEQLTSVAIGTGTMYVFTSYVAAAIISGTTTLTVSSATSQQYAVSWGGVTNAIEVNTANVSTNTGSSNAATVTPGNSDTTTSELNVAFFGNNSSGTGTGNVTGADDAVVNNGMAVTGGTLSSICRSVVTPPNTSGRGSVGASWSGSVAWGAISVPLVIANQSAVPVSLMSSTAAQAFTGTSGTITSRFTFNNFSNPKGTVVLFVQRPGTSTISASDTGSNSYTVQTTVSNGSTTAFCTVLTAPITADIGTITISDTVNQGHNVKAFYVAGATAVDTGGNASGTGTTSVSLTSGAPNRPADITLFASITAGVAISSLTGTGTATISNATQNSQTMAICGVFNIGSGTVAATGTTTSSTPIGIVSVSLQLPWYGGGGGGSAGSLGIGWPGYDTGGISPSGGGIGATGPQATSGGIPGGAPGGGGSGVMSSSGGTTIGGAGANGRVRITYTPPLPSFDNLILHMPGYNSPDTFNPVSPIPPLDVPDGREYVMQSLVPWRNAEFNGTYSVFLVAYNWSHAVSNNVTRRVTVTLTQYEYAGGPGYSMQVTRLITPSTDVINGIISMGNLPLPIKQYDESNEEPYYTYSVISSASGDRFMDILFLDTTGETVLINLSNAHPAYGSYANYYIEEPDWDTDVSPVLGSPHGPERAVSILDSTIMSGGPFFLVPGDNFLMAYSTYGAPNIGVRYNPRWYTDRTKF